jgi:hypothetical protein
VLETNPRSFPPSFSPPTGEKKKGGKNREILLHPLRTSKARFNKKKMKDERFRVRTNGSKSIHRFQGGCPSLFSLLRSSGTEQFGDGAVEVVCD